MPAAETAAAVARVAAAPVCSHVVIISSSLAVMELHLPTTPGCYAQMVAGHTTLHAPIQACMAFLCRECTSLSHCFSLTPSHLLPLLQAAAQLLAAGVRVEVMERASIPKMIRNAEKAKTPVMAVVGAKEAEGGTLAVRLYGGADLGSLPVDEVVQRIKAAEQTRSSF